MSLASNNNAFIMEASDNALVAPGFTVVVEEPIICSGSIYKDEAQSPTQFSFQFNGSSLHTDDANWQQYCFVFRNYGANPSSGPKGYSVAPFVETWSSEGEICNSGKAQNAGLSQYGFKEYFFDSDSIPAETLLGINLFTDSSQKIIQANFNVSVDAVLLMNVTIELTNIRTDFKDPSTGDFRLMTAADLSPLHVTTLNIVGNFGGYAFFSGGSGQILYRGAGDFGAIKWVEQVPALYRGDTTGETSNMAYGAITQPNGPSMTQSFAFTPSIASPLPIKLTPFR
jgi:hypothetical protein